MKYTVKRITVEDIDADLLNFIITRADELKKLYGLDVDYRNNFWLSRAITKHFIAVCYGRTGPVGLMFASLGSSMFDNSKKVLRQELLMSDNPIATAKLISYFIDFGRSHANYVIMCKGKHTNIKHDSFLKMGFTELEKLYILEDL